MLTPQIHQHDAREHRAGRPSPAGSGELLPILPGNLGCSWMWGLCFPPWTALLCAEKPALAFVRKQSTSWPTAQHECKAPLVGRGSNTEEMRTLGRIIPSTRSLPISLADQTLPLQITIHPRPCVHKHFTILNALLIPFISFLFFLSSILVCSPWSYFKEIILTWECSPTSCLLSYGLIFQRSFQTFLKHNSSFNKNVICNSSTYKDILGRKTYVGYSSSLNQSGRTHLKH